MITIKRVVEAALAKGYTEASLAKRLRLHRTTIANWLKGDLTLISQQNKDNILRLFGVDLSHIVRHQPRGKVKVAVLKLLGSDAAKLPNTTFGVVLPSVYAVMFDDDCCYIGQTINPIARLSDHYRRYTNSVDRFILLAVDVKKLLEVELEYIGVTEELILTTQVQLGIIG